MNTTKQNHELLSEEQRKYAVDALIAFFDTERGEEIGMIAAEELLDIFLQTTGEQLYNKGVDDTKVFIQQHSEEMLLDLEVAVKK